MLLTLLPVILIVLHLLTSRSVLVAYELAPVHSIFTHAVSRRAPTMSSRTGGTHFREEHRKVDADAPNFRCARRGCDNWNDEPHGTIHRALEQRAKRHTRHAEFAPPGRVEALQSEELGVGEVAREESRRAADWEPDRVERRRRALLGVHPLGCARVEVRLRAKQSALALLAFAPPPRAHTRIRRGTIRRDGARFGKEEHVSDRDVEMASLGANRTRWQRWRQEDGRRRRRGIVESSGGHASPRTTSMPKRFIKPNSA